MKMTENFKIIAEFVKDISSETPDVQSYIFAKENILKYHLNIDINSKALKNKMIEINTTLKFEDKESNEKRSYFEIVYASVIKIDEEIKNKKDLERRGQLCRPGSGAANCQSNPAGRSPGLVAERA